jgi:hypothetical protein
MTATFRQARDEGLRSLYVVFIRAGQPRLDAIEAVWKEQEKKYGLSLDTVRKIVCGYDYYARKKKVQILP